MSFCCGFHDEHAGFVVVAVYVDSDDVGGHSYADVAVAEGSDPFGDLVFVGVWCVAAGPSGRWRHLLAWPVPYGQRRPPILHVVEGCVTVWVNVVGGVWHHAFLHIWRRTLNSALISPIT